MDNQQVTVESEQHRKTLDTQMALTLKLSALESTKTMYLPIEPVKSVRVGSII
jgi:hypothetical protein